jgi:hypothetical protein
MKTRRAGNEDYCVHKWEREVGGRRRRYCRNHWSCSSAAASLNSWNRACVLDLESEMLLSPLNPSLEIHYTRVTGEKAVQC